MVRGGKVRDVKVSRHRHADALRACRGVASILVSDRTVGRGYTVLALVICFDRVNRCGDLNHAAT